MKITKRDSSSERTILTGMIVDGGVVGKVASKWPKEEGLFRSKLSNTIGGWCVRYYNKYARAPGKAIESIFQSWAAKASDKETIELVSTFLTSLSDEYESLKKESNTDYVCDLASQHFNAVALQRYKAELEGLLDVGELGDALKLVTKGFNPLEVSQSDGIDLLSDYEALKKAFKSRGKALVTYPGALGNFFKNHLSRDCFVAIMAPEKSGKSYLLQDIAWNAMLQKNKVAYFEVGDLSQDQVERRFAIRAAGRPLDPCLVKFPISIENEFGDCATVQFKEREFKNSLKLQKAWDAYQTIGKKVNGEPLVKMFCHPNDSINVQGITAILQRLARNGWAPDVVIVDYADILAPPYGASDGRDQINKTWKQLRALSQSYHCLVVTATQSDAESYDVKTISRRNFSEDKRKYAHVTGMLAINATEEEKEIGVSRYNWVVLREDKFITGKCVHVAGCLELARPCIVSTF